MIGQRLALIFLLMAASPAPAQQPSRHQPHKPALPFGGIIRGDYGGKVHYLAQVTFERDDIRLGAGFKFRSDGQFDIALRNPDAAKCTTLTVHMPRTNPALPDKAAWIAEKRALFAQFEALKRGEIDSVKAELEVSPSAEFAFDRGWALSSCTIFFRDVDGRYLASTADIVTKHVPW